MVIGKVDRCDRYIRSTKMDLRIEQLHELPIGRIDAIRLFRVTGEKSEWAITGTNGADQRKWICGSIIYMIARGSDRCAGNGRELA